jgi:hypothetical protein
VSPGERRFLARSEAEREALASVPHRLVGRRLLGVRYFELFSETATGPGWAANGFHALDYGVELDVDGPRETWSVTWKMAGDVEALLLYDGPLVGHELRADGEYGRWDVAAEAPWATIVGQRIVSAELLDWEGYGAAVAPGALHLRFEQGEVVMVLGAATPNGGFAPSVDDVAVFASLEQARAHGAITERSGAP